MTVTVIACAILGALGGTSARAASLPAQSGTMSETIKLSAQNEEKNMQAVVKDGHPRYVSIRVIPEKTAIGPGETMMVAVEQTHQPEWHTYWKNPGDSGEPTTIDWELPANFKAGEIAYPAPVKLPYGPLMNYGFGGKVVLLVPITAPDQLPANDGMLQFKANISWLVCKDICVPEMEEVAFQIPVADAAHLATPTDAEYFRQAKAALPERQAWQGRMEEQEKQLHLIFRPDDAALKDLQGAKDFYFFPEEWGVAIYNAPQIIKLSQPSASDPSELEITLMRDTRPLSELSNLRGVLSYETANGQRKSVALDMAIGTTKAGQTGAAPDSSLQDSTPQDSSLQEPPGANVASATNTQDSPDITVWRAIILALLGGVILNLMPCVFPVLSLKALSLIKLSEKEQGHAVTHGVFYTLGILTCFGLIVGVLIFLKSAGEQIGWGFQLQNPMVVLGLAYLLFIMGLNLSGFFEFKGHLISHIGNRLTARQGYSGTFFTGMLATIVATPCTAPFMATAIGYALTQPPAIVIAIFMALGFGLALPYLLLCVAPPLRSVLPRPGAWMETFRQFMAFPLYASVAWLIWVYGQQIDGDYGLLVALAGLVLIGFSVWITRHNPKRQPMKSAIHILSYLAMILALMIVALSAMKENMMLTNQELNQELSQNTSHGNHMDYKPFSRSALETALKGEHPIFINMTAAWCITCKINERLAINTQTVQDAFAKYDVQYFKGDWTNRNPEITQFLSQYHRNGVPLYVYIGPPVKSAAGGSAARPDPVVLPQILTPALITDNIAVQ
ncbi:MAG: thioredoxin family protein [Alphaproteobacteria bacterium]|nr:thioredoxin family protein [Alphaproteobacteria bacterium]